jgi:multiple sugar transport system permease protein
MTVNATSGAPPATRIGRPAGPPRARRRLDLLPYALVTPLTLFIVLLALLPAAFTIIESFFRVRPLYPPPRFNGLENYRRLFSDPTIRASMVNTLLYVAIGITLSTVLGVAMAIALQRPFRGRAVVIAIMVLPWALPGVVEGVVWSGIFDANNGLLNSLLTSLRLFNHYHVFLGEHRVLTVFLIELVQVWQLTPLSVLLVFASLQNIPGDLYEAATLDGSSSWATFWRITLPLARPGIAIAMVQALVQTLNVFDQPYVLNGAAVTGTSVTEQTYFVSFQNLDFGEGYALSLVITVATIVLGLVITRLVYRKVEF